MNKRLVIVVSSVVILVLAVALVYVVMRNVNGPEIYVDPQTTVAGPGQNFTINVRISDASDLYGWELGLSWNSTLFDNASAVEGSFFNGSTFFVPVVNITGGYIFLDDTLLGASTPGVNGNGVLTIIQLHVSSSGSCPLHLYDVILLNPQTQSTVPTLRDGQFSTT
jgi:hypothetical protein